MQATIFKSINQFILIYLLLSSSSAYAYLDPGSGSIILQGIIGIISAGFVILRVYWNRFLGLFQSKKKIEEDKDTDKEKMKN